MGLILYALATAERRKALTSLAIAFPMSSLAEHQALARASFGHLGEMLFELACISQVDARMESLVQWPAAARQVLEAALRQNKGVVFVSGHVGNWELLARRVALAGFDCQSIAKETSDPRLTRWIEAVRQGAGLKSIWRGQPGAAKHMLRALKGNGILGLLIDQDTKVQSVFVDFFGKPAKTPRAAADLALKTGAPVVVGFCHRTSPGHYRIEMKAITAVNLVTDAALTLTQQLTYEIESAIRSYPEQWVWMHQRWRSVPDSHP
jgi:Kdo2-lipid IVA lauroyltransferase/acyltransferase